MTAEPRGGNSNSRKPSSSSRLLTDYSKCKATLSVATMTTTTRVINNNHGSTDIRPSSAAGKAILSASACKLLHNKDSSNNTRTEDILTVEDIQKAAIASSNNNNNNNNSNGSASLRFDESLQSLTDPFFLEDDDGDEVEEDVTEEYSEYTNSRNHNDHNNGSLNQSLNDSELSLTTPHDASQSSFSKNGKSTSKRRLYRRRSRRNAASSIHGGGSSSQSQLLQSASANNNNNNSSNNASLRSLRARRNHGSSRNLTHHSLPDLGVDYVVVDAKTNPSATTTNTKRDMSDSSSRRQHPQLSLGAFLEQTSVDHDEQHRRSKTSLLPGSTTEDLCSEMNEIARGRRANGGRTSRTTPRRSSTAPEIHVAPSSRRARTRSSSPMAPPSDPTPNTAVAGSSSSSSNSKLRDYSQGGGRTRNSVSPSRRVLPRRTKSQDDFANNNHRTSFHAFRKMGPISKMVESMHQSIGHGMSLYDDDNDNDNDNDNHQNNDEYDEDLPETPPIPGTITGGRRPRSGRGGPRRLPPRCHSADGSVRPRSTPRRTATDPTGGGGSSGGGSSSSMNNSGNSFLTGSRIRRITPGTSVSSGLALSTSGMSSSLRNVHAMSSRTSSRSPTRSSATRRSISPNNNNNTAGSGGSGTRMRAMN